jgi:hypothetical protein
MADLKVIADFQSLGAGKVQSDLDKTAMSAKELERELKALAKDYGEIIGKMTVLKRAGLENTKEFKMLQGASKELEAKINTLGNQYVNTAEKTSLFRNKAINLGADLTILSFGIRAVADDISDMATEFQNADPSIMKIAGSIGSATITTLAMVPALNAVGKAVKLLPAGFTAASGAIGLFAGTLAYFVLQATTVVDAFTRMTSGSEGFFESIGNALSENFIGKLTQELFGLNSEIANTMAFMNATIEEKNRMRRAEEMKKDGLTDEQIKQGFKWDDEQKKEQEERKKADEEHSRRVGQEISDTKTVIGLKKQIDAINEKISLTDKSDITTIRALQTEEKKLQKEYDKTLNIKHKASREKKAEIDQADLLLQKLKVQQEQLAVNLELRKITTSEYIKGFEEVLKELNANEELFSTGKNALEIEKNKTNFLREQLSVTQKITEELEKQQMQQEFNQGIMNFNPLKNFPLKPDNTWNSKDHRLIDQLTNRENIEAATGKKQFTLDEIVNRGLNFAKELTNILGLGADTFISKLLSGLQSAISLANSLISFLGSILSGGANLFSGGIFGLIGGLFGAPNNPTSRAIGGSGSMVNSIRIEGNLSQYGEYKAWINGQQYALKMGDRTQ